MDKSQNYKLAKSLADYIITNADKQYTDPLGKHTRIMILGAAHLIMSAPIKHRKIGHLITCYRSPAYVRTVLQYETDFHTYKYWTTSVPKLMKMPTAQKIIELYIGTIKSAFSKSISPDTDIFDATFAVMESKQKPSSDSDLSKAVEKATRIANFRKHAETILFPILKPLTINEKTPNPGTIFIRSDGKGLSEGLVTDGPLKPGESLDDHIATVNHRAEKQMKETSDKNSSENISYIGDYDGFFHFKLYLHDVIIEKNSQTGIIRSINAFFIDPKFNDFYQLYLSNGPFIYNPDKLTLGKLDRENNADKIMRNAMLSILSEIKRK